MNKASSKFKIGKKCVLLSTVAPWAYKDKKLLTFKISTKILAISIFSPLIPNLCADKSEIGRK